MKQPTAPARDNSVVVQQTANLTEAGLLRAALANADIASAVFLHDPLSGIAGIIEILVLSADHARAQALIKEFEFRPISADWTCRHCSETVPGHFDICWNCLSERDTEISPTRGDEAPLAATIGN